MCELLIFVNPKDPNDPVNPLKYQAGDVIVIVDDGWAWSQRELTNPDWRVVKAPGVDKALMSNLLTPTRNGDQVVARRTSNLDLTTQHVDAKTTVNLGNVIAATKARNGGDQAVIGSVNVIGR